MADHIDNEIPSAHRRVIMKRTENYQGILRRPGSLMVIEVLAYLSLVTSRPLSILWHTDGKCPPSCRRMCSLRHGNVSKNEANAAFTCLLLTGAGDNPSP